MVSIPDEPILPEAEWTAVLRREVRRLALWPAIDASSLNVISGAQGLVFVVFDLQTDRLLEPTRTPIWDVEPLAFVYPSIEQVGQTAPSVWSRRADFPRDIGHINPRRADEPASLCLARVGLQPIYDHRGIDGVVEVASSSLASAGAGSFTMRAKLGR